MVAIHCIRILLTEVRTFLISIFRQAQARERLIKAQPSLATTFGRNSQIDSNSTIGALSIVGENSSIMETRIGSHINLREKTYLMRCLLQDYVSIGNNSVIENSFINSYTYLGKYCIINNTFIGKFCSIAQGLSCGSGNHPTDLISTSPLFYSSSLNCEITFSHIELYGGNPTTHIGHDVWIGANVFVKSGITIGNGAIVAAGAIVMKDVTPYSIVGGVPAKEIRKRYTNEDIAILENIQWWNWPEEHLREAVTLFQQGSVSALAPWYVQRKLKL